MHAIKGVRKYLQSHPDTADALVLRRLTAALAEEREFKLAELYGLEREAFELAMDLLADWRLDRYYAARIKLFDVVLGSEPGLGAAGDEPRD